MHLHDCIPDRVVASLDHHDAWSASTFPVIFQYIRLELVHPPAVGVMVVLYTIKTELPTELHTNMVFSYQTQQAMTLTHCTSHCASLEFMLQDTQA